VAGPEGALSLVPLEVWYLHIRIRRGRCFRPTLDDLSLRSALSSAE
jgi:hypothetical protein